MNIIMRPKAIKTKEPFKGLFPVEEHVLNAVIEDMKVNGYDSNFPVIIWKGRNICVDGHTRLAAAKIAGLNHVPISVKDFPGEDEALQYAIHCQRDRRDMTDRNILRCIEVVDRRKDRGGDHKSGDFQKSKSSSEPIASAETTARIIGTSASKVKKVRTILDHADDETKAAVKTGEKSIHRAYVEIQGKRKPKPKKQTSSGAKLST